MLGNSKASKQVYNISGEKYVTFDGIAKACAKVHWMSFSSKNERGFSNYCGNVLEILFIFFVVSH